MDEAAAVPPSSDNAVDSQLSRYLWAMFPDVSPDYIRKLCDGKPYNDVVAAQLTTLILDMDAHYPKQPIPTPEPEIFPENQLETFKEFLPDQTKPDKEIAFINEAMEEENYSKLKDSLRHKRLTARAKRYTTEFTVKTFITVISDPIAFFADPARSVNMDLWSSHYAMVFLRNTFNKTPIKTIQAVFAKHPANLSATVRELREIVTSKTSLLKAVRKPMQLPQYPLNIPLLQEIAYIKHEQEILDYLKQVQEKERAEREEARTNGLLKTCQCCYDEEVLLKDRFFCGCYFCKSCIAKSVKEKLRLPCRQNHEALLKYFL